ncbi:kinesin-like protein KIF18A [Agrilus planipennis]|uniref:Kinesin-like protein n=1 Tax=Agrilus planipennis TaxID=224129 RepID=A0A1W4WP19_AGRPL|nr:kinesin-like protein KIF18A [Agrilus planipennis]
MVKSKRDLLKSPRRRSFTLLRSGVRNKINVNSGADICVVVRVRPPNANEQGDNFRKIIKVVSDEMLIFDPKEENDPFFYHGVQQKGRDLLKKANKNLQFHFDRVFGFEATNAEVFEKSTKSLIDKLMDGYNCSVFAYGATGAGKTFTMIGKPDNPGITVLTMSELFKRKEELSNERDFELGITYLEVYNETVQDLLNPGSPLNLREDGKFGVIVAGVQVKRIESCEELFELLQTGNQNRTQHPTDANAESSRSHAVFQVYIKMSVKTTQQILAAKLSMIDLAGSERGAATGYSGARFTEGANINKSLLALGNCINSLADGQRHIPYRDSKLTRLLKDSLGGNCKTVMIANVSPVSLNIEDTYNTLKYATRAKKIKAKLKKNVVSCSTNIQFYIKQNEALQQENEKLKLEIEQLKSQVASTSSCTCNKMVNIEVASPLKQDEQQCEEKGDSTNLKIKEQLKALFTRRLILEEQIVSNSMSLFTVRKELKEFADTRLSGLCTEQSDKADGHKRLGTAMENLQRQTERLEKDVEGLTKQVKEVDTEIESLNITEDSGEIYDYCQALRSEVEKAKLKSEADLYKRKSEILSGELRMHGELIQRMSAVLKPCFLQLRGYGYATNDMIKSYHDLVRHCQGFRTVCWKDEEASSADSGVGSTTTVIQSDVGENKKKTPNNKRKYAGDKDDENGLNETFVVPLSPAKQEKVLTRVTKTAPTKKLAKVQPPKLIRLTKENKDPTFKSSKTPQGKSSSHLLMNKTKSPITTAPKPLLKNRR